VRFVACAYCSTRLEIHHSGSAVYCEALEQIDRRTAEIADDLETIKLQNELGDLDRQWINDREKYKVRGQDGQYSVPTIAGSVIGMVVVVVFGVFWIGMAVNMGAPGFFPLFGVAFIVFAVVAGVTALTKAQGYQQRHSAYDSRRRELTRRIRDRS
jgi:ABC-type transport system involved in cytochrome bd biosynthesis fused ATPase/permease subunit